MTIFRRWKARAGLPQTEPSLKVEGWLAMILVAAASASAATAALPPVEVVSTVLEPEAVAQIAGVDGVERSRSPTPPELAGAWVPGWRPLAWAEQGNGERNGLYVLADLPVAGGREGLHTQTTAGWQELAPPPVHLMATMQPAGQSHLLFLAEEASGEVAIYGYHTITDTWHRYGGRPLGGKVETLRPGPKGFLVRVRDSAGGSRWHRLELVSQSRGLGGLDYAVILAYLAAVGGIGFYFYSRGKRDPASFFLGSRSIPWWAAGISLYATGTSAISFLAFPAKTYATNWLYFSQSIVGVAGGVYAACVLGPLIRRLNMTSVYEYLELRFHPVVRSIASAICIVQHLFGRMSVVLLLPSLALSAVLGVDVTACIVVMGLITTAYTVLGGMKAVIWTDVLQVFVMVGGALYAMSWMAEGAGGWGRVVDVALADGKVHLFDWRFDFNLPSVWVFLLIVIVQTLTWPQDQVMVQRVLSTKDDKAAARSMLTLAAMALPGSFMFFAIGTLLYAFYKANPGALNPLLTTDQIFPQFIAGQLPAGIMGLIIAGIFAASMATLSSNINSIATLVSVDFYERLVKGATPRKSVRLAEWTTVVTGLLGTGVALLLSRYAVQSLLDVFVAFMALFGGGFAGTYALGLFTRRANWQGAVIGIAASIAATMLVGRFTSLHVLMYVPVAIASCIGFGYAGSLFFPAAGKSLRGLTVYDPFEPGTVAPPAAGRGH